MLSDEEIDKIMDEYLSPYQSKFDEMEQFAKPSYLITECLVIFVLGIYLMISPSLFQRHYFTYIEIKQKAITITFTSITGKVKMNLDVDAMNQIVNIQDNLEMNYVDTLLSDRDIFLNHNETVYITNLVYGKNQIKVNYKNNLKIMGIC